jgi:cell division septal protein FtsQ
MKLTQEKIRIFFLSNQLLRKIKNFFAQKILPPLVKAILLFIVLLILVLFGLKIFNPNYLQKSYYKAVFYFFHYLNLDNQNFDQINIDGNSHVTKEQIIAIIDEVKKNNLPAKNPQKIEDYQPLIQKLIEQIKLKLPWVNQVKITRSLPNILNIWLSEHEPFAIWQDEEKKYLTSKDGNLMPYEELEQTKHMVILSGKGANLNAKSLFNIFTTYPDLSANVYSATWVSNRRWDIRFANGLLIKLPEDNLAKAWQQLIKIYNMRGSIFGLKLIDLRLSDKVYLEYDDEVIKELKSL